MIREMLDSDGREVLEIYAFGLATRNATFETKVPSWPCWDKNHLRHSRFVRENNGQVVGWVALSPVSGRDVYKGVAEVSIYIAKGYLGKGIGTELMQKVIVSSEAHGIWTLYASLFPENEASVRLHEKCGFKKVGIREKIARLDKVWRDTLIMERRSRIVGV